MADNNKIIGVQSKKVRKVNLRGFNCWQGYTKYQSYEIPTFSDILTNFLIRFI